MEPETEPLLLRRPANRAWGLAVAAVLVLLLLSAAGPLRRGLLRSPSKPVELTLLAGATEKGAGTPTRCSSGAAVDLVSFFRPARGHFIADETTINFISFHFISSHLISVCLDGTPPGYHLQRGSGSGSNNWLIHLEVSIHHSPFSLQNCLVFIPFMPTQAEKPTRKTR
jgi:hypothetical protein